MGSERRHRRVMRAFLGVLCTAGLVAVAPTAATAGPDDDAKRAGRAADRAEAVLEVATVAARNAARQLEAATAALPGAQKKVATSRGVVAAAQAEANTARRKADAARKAYESVAGKFEAAQDEVEQARERVDEIASASYMGADVGAINLLVGARGPRETIDRLQLVDLVMQKRQETVDASTVARRVARSEQDRSGLAKRRAEEAEQDAVDKLAAAKNAEAAAVKARALVLELADRRREALAVARSQRSAVLASYERAKAEEARVVAALRGWEVRQGGSVTSSMDPGARLLMPVHGWKTSDFGQRYDPYYRVWQLHAGTDIAAGGGTPIHAAADGRVIRAGWAGGYGNYTCISHGRLKGQGFSTCYGHQSRIDVYVGEYVRRGEVIGRVGTTGASTGYHLHFETRFDGVPRDPLGYLPACLC